MTEKRFTITQDFEEHHRQIRDNGKIVMGCFVQPQAEAIVNLLNELSDKLDCHILLTDQERQKASNFIKRIEKENKQLKEEIKDLNDILARYEEKELQK